MDGPNRNPLRWRLLRLAVSVLVGAAIGGAMAAVGIVRRSGGIANPRDALLLAVTAGGVGGAIHAITDRLRGRGELGYYTSWMLIGLAAFAPAIWLTLGTEPTATLVGQVLLFGPLGGVGLGFTWRYWLD